MKTLTAILLGLTMLACGDLRLDHPASQANPPTTTPSPSACDVNATAGLVPATDALPVLHEIREATFSRPYSCGANGYESSALFLSQRVHAQNAPDLLYNCGSADYIEASTAGDDFSLISDLGPVPLESVDAAKAFNYQRVVGYDNTFREDIDVVLGHTYAVLIAKSDHRALFVLNVVAHTPGCAMTIRYAVKQYSFLQTELESD